jgi:hypothetical protein
MVFTSGIPITVPPPPAGEAITTVGDLQGGIEEAERFLGFKVIRPDDAEL